MRSRLQEVVMLKEPDAVRKQMLPSWSEFRIYHRKTMVGDFDFYFNQIRQVCSNLLADQIWGPLVRSQRALASSVLPFVISPFLYLSLAPPAGAALFLRPRPVPQVIRCRRPALSHLMRLTCTFQKEKKKGRFQGGG